MRNDPFRYAARPSLLAPGAGPARLFRRPAAACRWALGQARRLGRPYVVELVHPRPRHLLTLRPPADAPPVLPFAPR